MKTSKIFGALLLLLTPTLTYAVFLDRESSAGNSFRATTLDVRFTSPTTKSFELTTNNTYTIDGRLRNTGELPNNNIQSFQYIRGNEELADYIQLSVTINGVTKYEDNLKDFKISENIPLAYNTLLKPQYTFSLTNETSLPETLLGKRIVFDIMNIAMQEGLTYPNGFNDVENMRIVISVPGPEISSSILEGLSTGPDTLTPLEILLEEPKLTDYVDEESL